MQDVPLGPEHGASFFTKEIEEALLADRVDLAVHSCKDLATRNPEELAIAAFPERVDPRDVLVTAGAMLDALPEGARVGTSSPRRRGFIEAVRPDVMLVQLRGNVPTRLRAVEEGRMDGVVLAAAGLLRLGLEERIVERLDPGIMLPAAAQGSLALQVRRADEPVSALVAALDDRSTRVEVEAERACLRRLEAGCQAPVGALARVEGGGAVLECAVVTPEGIVRARGSGESGDPESLGVRVAEEILHRVGVTSLDGLVWAGPGPRRSGAEG